MIPLQRSGLVAEFAQQQNLPTRCNKEYGGCKQTAPFNTHVRKKDAPGALLVSNNRSDITFAKKIKSVLKKLPSVFHIKQ